jgi:hypothetical protein
VRQLILHPNNTIEIFTAMADMVFIRGYKKNLTIHQVGNILVHRFKVGHTRKLNYHIRLNGQCYLWQTYTQNILHFNSLEGFITDTFILSHVKLLILLGLHTSNLEIHLCEKKFTFFPDPNTKFCLNCLKLNIFILNK